MFRKVLIANRGEIAVRIIRTCQKLGIETVAVYSRADKNSMHVKLADESFCIGSPLSKKSYLDIKVILKAAKKKRVDAIHPGYGFLSENAGFAKACIKSGVVFIGPSPDAIRLMGDKAVARKTMISKNVPVIPGSVGPISELEKALRVANEIGYPVIVKASAGGGGRGMRIAKNSKKIVNAMSGAIAEAQSTFGSCTIYIEKFIKRARHVEIQILADSHGNVVHLGERDCSVQRKHQKLLEESPARSVDEELRHKMADTGIRAAEVINYVNAGTVEFILDEKGNFYFMEMNTRIQVEHPVTELVTGVDIVEEQLRIACGEPLSFTQKDIKVKGHAIECRINAEDPFNGFMPCPGKIKRLELPSEDLARVDTHIYEGYIIPKYYDSLLAKIIVHASTRAKAIRKMLQALDEFVIEGVTTTIPFQKKLLQNKKVAKNDIHTKFVEEEVVERLSA